MRKEFVQIETFPLIRDGREEAVLSQDLYVLEKGGRSPILYGEAFTSIDNRTGPYLKGELAKGNLFVREDSGRFSEVAD